MRKRILLFLSFLVFLTTTAYSKEGNPFDELMAEVLSFFEPMKGTVMSQEAGIIASDLTVASGIKPGMRLTVLRQGKPYLHPITNEVIGQVENPVGRAEVIEVMPGGARLSLLSGDARAGDILRVSSTKVRLLFYQPPDISWGLSEEYYDTLKASERFELIDAPIYTEKDSEIMAEAKRLGADVGLILSEEERLDETILRQRLLWAEDMKPLLTSEAAIDKDYVRELSFGEEFFKPPKKQAFLVFNIPFRVSLIGTGDVNGDGQEEVILSTGRDIVFYSIGKTLKPALEGIEIKGKWTEEHLWLDVVDLNADKRHDILIAVMKNERISSYAYEYKDKTFSLIKKWDFFVRAVGDTLYGQKYRSGEGFTGPVFLVTADGQGPSLTLPEGVNLCDFAFIESPGGERLILAYDNRSYLNLYDMKGAQLWQSKEDYGEPVRKYEKESPTVMVEAGQWSIKDRVLVAGKIAIVLKRLPAVKIAPGMGYKNSELTVLGLKDSQMEERTLIDYIPGRAVDLAMSSENLLVLSLNIETKFSNILSGMGLVGNKLYVYPRRGKLSVTAR